MSQLRFIDASVFLYAFLKPQKVLSKSMLELKENAKRILTRINEGEDVITTVIHLSEIANILETRTSKVKSAEYIEAILSKQTIHVYDVDVASYAEAVLKAKEEGLGVNDALALIFMEKLGISEIYSFDRDFDKIKWVKRIWK